MSWEVQRGKNPPPEDGAWTLLTVWCVVSVSLSRPRFDPSHGLMHNTSDSRTYPSCATPLCFACASADGLVPVSVLSSPDGIWRPHVVRMFGSPLFPTRGMDVAMSLTVLTPHTRGATEPTSLQSPHAREICTITASLRTPAGPGYIYSSRGRSIVPTAKVRPHVLVPSTFFPSRSHMSWILERGGIHIHVHACSYPSSLHWLSLLFFVRLFFQPSHLPLPGSHLPSLVTHFPAQFLGSPFAPLVYTAPLLSFFPPYRHQSPLMDRVGRWIQIMARGSRER